jgi:hypothetical protein
MKRLLVRGAALSVLLATVIPGSFAADARPSPRITAAQARLIALKKYPHARAERSAPLENEEGKWQYAVTLRDGAGSRTRMHEVMVGAMSGKIEADETTTPREEAREKAAENRARRAKSHSLKTKNARG